MFVVVFVLVYGFEIILKIEESLNINTIINVKQRIRAKGQKKHHYTKKVTLKIATKQEKMAYCRIF